MLRLALGLSIALGLIAGCDRKSPATGGAGRKVTLALNWVPEPEFGGIYAARQSGAFARHGLDVQIQPGGAGAPVIQRVAAGQIQFGIASADEVIMARARGADVVALFATYQTCPQGLMVHRQKGLTQIGQIFTADLTVAMETGLPYAAYLKKKYGSGNAKIVPYDGGVARFLADKSFVQQCFIFSEPIAAQRAGADPQVFLVADAGYNPYTAVVVTRGQIVRQDLPLVQSMANALREGWEQYLRDPGPANQLMGQLNKTMDAYTFAAGARAQMPLIQPAPNVPVGTMDAGRWQQLADQLVELGLVDRAPGPAECFVNVLVGTVGP